jgi:hypothetical protein
VDRDKDNADTSASAELEAAIEDWFQKPDGHYLIKAIAGIGKSRTTAKKIANLPANLKIWWLVPTHGRAEEQGQEYAAFKKPASLRVYVVRGRQAPNPDFPDENMCRRSDLAEVVSRVGGSVKKILCEACPFRHNCAYLEQEDELRNLEVGLFILPHDYATVPSCPAPRPDRVIIDESIIPKFVDHFSIHPLHLERTCELLEPSRGESCALCRKR